MQELAPSQFGHTAAIASVVPWHGGVSSGTAAMADNRAAVQLLFGLMHEMLLNRLRALALHSCGHSSTVSDCLRLIGAGATGACPYGVKAHKVGSVPMHQALHGSRQRSTHLAVSIASQDETT